MAVNLLTPHILTTFGVLAASAATVATVNIKARKPRSSLTPPLIAPHTISIIGMGIALMAIIHLITLLGLHHR